jgi:hypothetical protein
VLALFEFGFLVPAQDLKNAEVSFNRIEHVNFLLEKLPLSDNRQFQIFNKSFVVVREFERRTLHIDCARPVNLSVVVITSAYLLKYRTTVIGRLVVRFSYLELV